MADRQDDAAVRTATVDVPTAAKILGVSRNTAYAGVRGGSIPSIRIGRLIRVPLPALYRLLGDVQR